MFMKYINYGNYIQHLSNTNDYYFLNKRSEEYFGNFYGFQKE